MRHSTSTCSIILPSTIKIFPINAELLSRNENDVKYGSGDIIRKRRLAKLSFLHATLRIDLLYIILPCTCTIKMFLTVLELCSGNQHEEKYGSRDISRKWRQPELSFLYATFRIIKILPSIIQIFRTVAELCSGNQLLTPAQPSARNDQTVFRWKTWLKPCSFTIDACLQI